MKLKMWSVQKNGGTDAEGPSPPAAAAAAAQLGVCRLSFPGRTATDYPAIQNTHTQCTKSSRALFSLTNVTGSGNICRKTSFYPSTFLLVGLKLCQVSYFWSFFCVCLQRTTFWDTAIHVVHLHARRDEVSERAGEEHAIIITRVIIYTKL